MTSSAVRRGVPRSPNSNLDQPGVVREIEFARLQIQLYCFRDVLAGLFFGVTGGSASGQLRADRRPSVYLCVVFEHDTEGHSPRLRQQLLHDVPVHIGEAEVAALEAVGQLLMVEAEQVQNGGM